ncbi:hypothetical protein Syun_012004 [Stephania yunnanensis]|uniref:Agenet-like domain-containing protein n=1 Tax=Stephania yunnanensis TaxID=152371 RepID=A0AAP0JZE1_9MAGN
MTIRALKPEFEKHNRKTYGASTREVMKLVLNAASHLRYLCRPAESEWLPGAYYTTKVVKPLSHNQYLVQYQTLITNDESSMLREVVNAIHVRPLPLVIRALEFRMCDEIDVYSNDGWCVGRVVDGKEGMCKMLFDWYGKLLSWRPGRQHMADTHGREDTQRVSKLVGGCTNAHHEAHPKAIESRRLSSTTGRIER